MKKEKYIYIAGIIFGFLLFFSSYFNSKGVSTPIVRASSTAHAVATSLTFSLNLPTLETNEIIIIFSSNINPTMDPYSGATVNGVSATPGGGGVMTGTTPTGYWSYLVATSSGQHNITTTWAGASAQWSSAVAISGVDTSNQVACNVGANCPISASSTKGYGASTAPNFQVSGTVDELLLNRVHLLDNVQINSLGVAGETYSYFSRFVDADTRNINLISETATTTGQNSMSYTTSINDSVYGFILSIKAATEAAAVIPSIESDFILFE